MKNKKLIANYVLFVILLILPVVEAIISLCFAPNQIPMHFDRYGNVDRYGPKFELLIVPCLNIVFGLAFVAWKRTCPSCSRPANGWAYRPRPGSRPGTP